MTRAVRTVLIGCCLATSTAEARAQQRVLNAEGRLQAAAVPTGPARPGFVQGRVVTDSGRVPMPGVEVYATVGARRVATTTDEQGRFRVPVAVGAHAVTARKIGYREAVTTGDVRSPGHIVFVELRLKTAPLELPAVTVEARNRLRASALQRVSERRFLGVGQFVDRAEVERRGGPPLAELLRGVAGVRVTGSGPTAMITMARVAHSCYPVIYLDGSRLNRAFDPPDEIRAAMAMVPGRTIETVEVYRGPAETPGEFSGAETPCGVVAVWTVDPTSEWERRRAPLPVTKDSSGTR